MQGFHVDCPWATLLPRGNEAEGWGRWLARVGEWSAEYQAPFHFIVLPFPRGCDGFSERPAVVKERDQKGAV